MTKPLSVWLRRLGAEELCFLLEQNHGGFFANKARLRADRRSLLHRAGNGSCRAAPDLAGQAGGRCGGSPACPPASAHKDIDADASKAASCYCLAHSCRWRRGRLPACSSMLGPQRGRCRVSPRPQPRPWWPWPAPRPTPSRARAVRQGCALAPCTVLLVPCWLPAAIQWLGCASHQHQSC